MCGYTAVPEDGRTCATIASHAVYSCGQWPTQYRYIRLRNTRTEMYAGRVADCHLVSHVKHAPHTFSRLEIDGTDRQTVARPLHYYD